MRGYSGRVANQIWCRSGAFWQQEGYDRWVRDCEERDRVIRCIECNPVKTGLVSHPGGLGVVQRV